MGAAAAVCTACLLSWLVDQLRYYYYGRLLQNGNGDNYGAYADCAYKYIACVTNLATKCGFGRPEDYAAQKLAEKIGKQKAELADPNHARSKIELTEEEEKMTVSVVVDAQDHNIWSVLMPAVYQLVPGSVIAKLWFNAIFPPPLVEEEQDLEIAGTNYTYVTYSVDQAAENVFSNLFVISTSLALGLMIGFALVQLFEAIFCGCGICTDTATDIYGGGTSTSKRVRKQQRMAGMYAGEHMTDAASGMNEEIVKPPEQPLEEVVPMVQAVDKEEAKEAEEDTPPLPQEASA